MVSEIDHRLGTIAAVTLLMCWTIAVKKESLHKVLDGPLPTGITCR